MRLPRLPRWSEVLEREATWLPRLAPRVSLRVPEPIAVGHATEAYPCTWAIYRWLPGTPYGDGPIEDSAAAVTWARFVQELRSIDPTGGPSTGRAPLAELDVSTRTAVEAARGAIDADAASAAWTRALAAPVWDGTPGWLHGRRSMSSSVTGQY